MEDNIPEDRRTVKRLDAGHLVIHSDSTEEDAHRPLSMAVTIDLNEFGFKVQSTEPLALGERFRFSVALQEDVVEATGQVVHVNRALNGTFEMGVEFVDISAASIERLRKYVAEQNPA